MLLTTDSFLINIIFHGASSMSYIEGALFFKGESEWKSL